MNENEITIQEDKEQINEFTRSEKKKSSLKSSKTNYKGLKSPLMSNIGIVNMKSLKWKNQQLEQLELEEKPHTNIKKLNESKSIYKAYVIK